MEQPEFVNEEIDKVLQSIHRNAIDIVTVPILKVDFGGDLENFFGHYKANEKVKQIAVDISTEFLHQMSIEETSVFIDNLAKAAENKWFQGISCAVNSFTVVNSMQVLNVAKRYGLPSMASGVLRAHWRRPGVLADTSRGPTESVTVAVEKFHAALDRCLHAEIQYLKKVRSVKSTYEHTSIGILSEGRDRKDYAHSIFILYVFHT